MATDPAPVKRNTNANVGLVGWMLRDIDRIVGVIQRRTDTLRRRANSASLTDVADARRLDESLRRALGMPSIDTDLAKYQPSNF